MIKKITLISNKQGPERERGTTRVFREKFIKNLKYSYEHRILAMISFLLKGDIRFVF